MSNLLYVGAAILLSVIGSLIIYARHHKPKSLYSGIDEFNRELRALSPEHQQGQGNPGSGQRGQRRG